MYIDIHFENHFDNHNHNYHILVGLDIVLDIVVGIDNMANFQHIGIVFFFFDVFFCGNLDKGVHIYEYKD